MKLFQRSLVSYAVWVTFIYLCVGLYNGFIYRFTDIIVIQMIWLFILALPFWIKPLAKFLNTTTLFQ
jgi:ABC-type spermidine/putrescine transport system permease subunit I